MTLQNITKPYYTENHRWKFCSGLEDGVTPLHIAVSQGHLQVVQGLLDAGAGKDEALGESTWTSLGRVVVEQNFVGLLLFIIYFAY